MNKKAFDIRDIAIPLVQIPKYAFTNMSGKVTMLVTAEIVLALAIVTNSAVVLYSV